MKKRVLSLIMAAMMVAGMLTGCGGGSSESADTAETENSTTTAAKEEEMTSIVFAFPMIATVDMGRIETAFNEITEPELNIHVKLEGITMSNYANQVSLMQSGGEQVDLIGYFGTYGSWLANSQLMCLDDYIETYGQDIIDTIGWDYLKTTSMAGRLYAVPSWGGKATTLQWVVRTDLVNELGLDMDITPAATFEEYLANLDLVTEQMATITAAHPEYVCAVPDGLNPNTLMVATTGYGMDTLADGYGVLKEGDTNVTNYYESDTFAELCQLMYQWNQAGYVLEDATTTQEADDTYLQNGRTAALILLGSDEKVQETAVSTSNGIPVTAADLAEPVITTNAVNYHGFAISATSKYPEAAMKIMNLLYGDERIVNLLDWGVEGEDYVKNDNGTIDYPEGVTSEIAAYNLNMSWYFGNSFLSYTWGENGDQEASARMAKKMETAKKSDALGFGFDNTEVSTEIAALSNVISEYIPGLACGAVDPSDSKYGISALNEALYDAGLQAVMDEKQKQLDEWRAENQ